MKRVLLVGLTLLFLAGVSEAHFKGAMSPKSTNGSASEKITIFNNSGSALDRGDVVVYDFDNSTGDDDLYVTTTTTADTLLVAGVVWSNDIAIGDEGSIVVWGFAQCDIAGHFGEGVTSVQPICTSTTAGSGRACQSGNAGASYAISALDISAGSQGNCFVKGQ